MMRGIVKTFGPVRALDEVDLVVGRHEVHGLLGGNGAGKTTLMNVLYGLYRANAGSIVLDGVDVTIGSPRDAIDLGIGMVHQTFLQVDTYTVAENIVLGTDASGGLRLDLSEAKERIVELSERFGLAVDPDAVAGQLPVGVRQRVEILKSLYRGAKVLILDEPTTNLTPQEVEALFGSMRAMVEEGMSVILITHKIKETFAVCDRLTVMRDGHVVETLARAATDADHVAGVMVGEAHTADSATAAVIGAADPVGSGSVRDRSLTGPGFDTAVAVRDLGVRNDHGVELITDFGLDVGRGEIVAFAGVAGNGQVELAEALAGVRPLQSGRVEVAGEDLAGRPTVAWLQHGVAYVPEDRNRDGILPSASITENLVLGSQRSAAVKRHGLIDWRAARQRAVEAIRTFSVRANGPGTPAGDLSGGNIQRVILARAFAHEPRLLILHNPTRGLDIRSTSFVYDRVRRAADDGCSVVLISEDLDEVIALADRVLALYQGSIVGSWPRGDVDPYVVGRSMTGMVSSDG